MNNIDDVDIKEITKNFRLSYSKDGAVMYVIPREDAKPLMVKGLPTSNEDMILYGTRIILHIPCDGTIYGRHLIQLNYSLWGVYVITTVRDCKISIDWDEQGISTGIDLRDYEALLIIVRLMGLSRRRIRPSSDALRIMRILGIWGKLLYSDLGREIQVFGIVKGPTYSSQGDCVNEVVIGNWRLSFIGCGFVLKDCVNNVQFLIITNVEGIIVSRYYPSLSYWYELGRVRGFDRYFIALKG